VLEQLDFVSTILSRFDLVFILRDTGRQADDVAEIIENRRQLEAENQDKEWVSKYIEYAKEEYTTEMTEEADEALKEAFCCLGSDDLNPRYLDALERLARSNARLNLREEVKARDVEVAYELIRESFSQLGLDDESENIDLQKIESGISEKEQDLLQEIGDRSSLMSLRKQYNGELDGMLEELEEAGLVYVDEDDDLVSTL
jgi:replicative DNA helicase Mcm